MRLIYAGMAELADAPDLGSGVNTCGFDPCQAHHKKALSSLTKVLFLMMFAFALKNTAIYDIFSLMIPNPAEVVNHAYRTHCNVCQRS